MLLRNLCLALILAAMSSLATAQTHTATVKIDNDFVQKQFGSSCNLIVGPPPIVADLDNDGVMDVAFAAKCTNPLIDQAENTFKVVDPYNTYFGYGDTRITTEFASEDPDFRGRSLLIIHGDGPQAWRSDTPKAKFVIINLPYKQFIAKKMAGKKGKMVMGVFVEEADADRTTSVVFWDGKKYKYAPLGANLE